MQCKEWQRHEALVCPEVISRLVAALREARTHRETPVDQPAPRTGWSPYETKLGGWGTAMDPDDPGSK